MNAFEKHVVVLAHGDGWGALNANNLLRYMNAHYPDVGVFLIVSQATKNADGHIATKLDDLKIAREIKETRLQQYFEVIDSMDAEERVGEPDLLTFRQMAGQYCADGRVHYTSAGGKKGGREVLALVEGIKTQYGIDPDLFLSVDTMAFVPPEIANRYDCFSTHPGPLDSIRILGMQGTMRQIANNIYFDRDGVPLTPAQISGFGEKYLKGTLFLQHEALDEGPPIATSLTPVCPGMCAYYIRASLYDSLINLMQGYIPDLLDRSKRKALIAEALEKKREMDAAPHQAIPALDVRELSIWQRGAYGVPSGDAPYIEVLQNEMMSPTYFKNEMRRYFPGDDETFDEVFDSIFKDAFSALDNQVTKHAGPPVTFHVGAPSVLFIRG